MLVENKYKQLYFKIIDKAKSENRDKKIAYYERHHIIPKSFICDDSDENLVLLTAREHFICHKLLTKCTLGEYRKKMFCALWAFNRKSKNQQRRIINSRDYEYARKNISKIFSENRKGKPSGYSLSVEQREKISQSLKGKPKSEKTKQQMKESWKKRGPRTIEHCKALSEASKGKIISTETRKKMSAAKKGINPIHTQVKWRCEFCSKVGIGISNYNRWHNGRCKGNTDGPKI